jgi:hypothetical protein
LPAAERMNTKGMVKEEEADLATEEVLTAVIEEAVVKEEVAEDKKVFIKIFKNNSLKQQILQ